MRVNRAQRGPTIQHRKTYGDMGGPDVEARQSPKQNCPVTHPCVDRAIVTSLSASRLPPVHPAQCGCRPCSLHSAEFRSAIPPRPGIGCHRPGGSAPFLPRCLRACRLPAAVVAAGSCLAAVTGVVPVATHPVRQRLGTGAVTALRGGVSVGASLAPTVIRRRFRSTVAVPIPFTRARSSTRMNGPCCRRYATIAWAFLGPTFVNPSCNVDASAVLMLIRSAARAVPVNSSPSASAFHENQGPTV